MEIMDKANNAWKHCPIAKWPKILLRGFPAAHHGEKRAALFSLEKQLPDVFETR
jgi:hypothetical protein